MESSYVTPVDRNANRIVDVSEHVGLCTQLCNNDGQFQRTAVDEVIVMKFIYDEEETCVLIENELCRNSTIEKVMKIGEVFDDFKLSIDDTNVDEIYSHNRVENYKYIVKTKGKGFSLKWKQISRMTIDTFTKLKNVDTEYTIEIVAK